MKFMTLAAAGLIAVSGVTFAAPEAQAQRWDRGDRGWNNGWRGERRWDNRRHWDNRRWDRGNRYRSGYRGYRGGRSFNRCHWERGYYGPVRRCYRVWR